MSLATNFEISTEAEIPPQSSHLQQDDGFIYDSDTTTEMVNDLWDDNDENSDDDDNYDQEYAQLQV